MKRPLILAIVLFVLASAHHAQALALLLRGKTDLLLSGTTLLWARPAFRTA